MKLGTLRGVVALSLLAFGTAGAQLVVPATPKKFTKRGIGTSGSGSSVSIDAGTPAGEATVRHLTRVVLSDTRQWQSTDGRTLLGRLIAFEDLTAEVPEGAPVPAMDPPAHPTVVKDGKARLLVGNKPYELPLERLSDPDREFVESVRAALARRADPAE